MRYADVAEDVAHLAMDLDFYMREDLRRHFISKYIAESNDQYLYSLIHFLMCYKACMRGKVIQFKASNEINEKRRLSYEKESGKLFTLAESYLILF